MTLTKNIMEFGSEVEGDPFLEVILWVFLFGVFIMDIGDIFRHGWFFQSLASIIYWNIAAICRGLGIAGHYLSMRGRR